MSAPNNNYNGSISQLESLKFKANQIIDSIQSLQRTIDAGNMAVMPSWPDILSKYNILLSQTLSFSMGISGTLSAAATSATTSAVTSNPLERVVLHPSGSLTDAQLDGQVIPLLRNQQTTDVLRLENDTVRRLAEHMSTKGSLGVLGASSTSPPTAMPPTSFSRTTTKPVEYADVLNECDEIRSAHDRRVERAVKAVLMLRERFEWRARVEVEVEEPEELEWDPRAFPQAMDDEGEPEEGAEIEAEGEDGNDANGAESKEGEADVDVAMEGDGDVGSSDEDEVQALVASGGGSFSPVSPTTMPFAIGQMIAPGADDSNVNGIGMQIDASNPPAPAPT